MNELKQQMEQLLESQSGTFGVAVKHLQTGEQVSINGERFFQMASCFKVPILASLFNEVEQGRIDLAEKITLTRSERVPGSGVLKELDEGVTLSVKDLATLMIIISDNTATDKLLQLIGKAKVQTYMNELGLDQISIQQSCWELLATGVGIDPIEISDEAYEHMNLLISQGKFDPKSVALHETKASNICTAPDMNLLLEKIEQRDGIPEASSRQMIDILTRQQLKQRLPYLLPERTKIAHKTGTVGGTVNDVGILYLPEENGTILISILSTGNPSIDAGAHAIAKLARIVFDYYMQKAI